MSQLRGQSRRGLRNVLIAVERERTAADLSQWLSQPSAARARSRLKCRIRDPWYSIPLGPIADYFLPSMASDAPRLCHNTARTCQSNTILGVRLTTRISKHTRLLFAALFRNPLTRLSAEIEGRRYGGGVLKLEPSDAERVLVFHPETASAFPRLERVGGSLHGPAARAQDASQGNLDILVDHLGLNYKQVVALSEVTEQLRDART